MCPFQLRKGCLIQLCRSEVVVGCSHLFYSHKTSAMTWVFVWIGDVGFEEHILFQFLNSGGSNTRVMSPVLSLWYPLPMP